ENIAGVRVVKAFAKESAQVKKFRDKKEVFLGTLLDTVNYWAARVPFAQFVFGLGLPLALWIGGRQVIRGPLAIGDLAKVVFYLMAIGHRVGMVGQFTNIIQNASASAERILEIIREPQIIKSGQRDLPDVTLATTPLTPPGNESAEPAARGSSAPSEGSERGQGPLNRLGRVQFDHVSFNYYDGKASLTDVSFEANPGQTIAIVGATGSGKTTLVNLVPRFYDVSGGRVLVDGADVRELKLGQLRRSVSVIFQETFLFSASVAENIAYGRPDAPRKEIEESGRSARALEFIW